MLVNRLIVLVDIAGIVYDCRTVYICTYLLKVKHKTQQYLEIKILKAYLNTNQI
jgi:hypothetical protein